MVNCYLLHSHTVNFRKKAPPPPERSKVRSLYSEQVETDLCAACHAFTLHGFSLFVLF